MLEPDLPAGQTVPLGSRYSAMALFLLTCSFTKERM